MYHRTYCCELNISITIEPCVNNLFTCCQILHNSNNFFEMSSVQSTKKRMLRDLSASSTKDLAKLDGNPEMDSVFAMYDVDINKVKQGRLTRLIHVINR